MSKKTALVIAVLSMAAICISMFTGCATQQNPAAESQAALLTNTGTMVLRVNPEISAHYNKDGLVTKLEGLNDDGLRIVEAYDDYIGKDCRAVVKDLVAKINDAGYFMSKVDGSYRNITIQIEPGSVLPQSDFLEVLAGDVQDSVKAMQLDSHVINIGPDDYSRENFKYISEAKAKEIALTHAGLKATDVTFIKAHMEMEDGSMEYDVEFSSGNREYDYEIDAVSGKILEFDSEIDDDAYRPSKDKQAQAANPSSVPANNQYISEAKAKEIALTHAGLKATDVTFIKAHMEMEDGRVEYDVEFSSGNREYEYEIDAASGKILEHDSKVKAGHNGTHNDDDDWDDDDHDDDDWDDDDHDD